ncbi:methyltransferase domain-containing protein [Butyrivibrio sp. YAB3001]|uniref:methyltransferase domain-containing protein n=1 Tax=Butyrivibrio sp. YAB3001 TaxID=1520812 RepID=UPI0008F64496|nr:methyltransferase domain-containing protein [Butyrivibrio sp. YAB3001]SFB94054.1 2-polyprenyl-3-methyl-5-hydroxy-6-metoxy-1,4-benzoquinol methylase [Butyrivibrio sp. YAB3001]
MENILSAIQNESWEEALELFLNYTEGKKLDEDMCIIGATILEHFDDSESLFEIIQSGLKLNIFNYELYILLGNYYSRTNPEKAYLTYENALYFARKYGTEEDIETVETILNDYREMAKPNVRKVTILVIYDEEKEYLKKCLDGIKDNCFRDCYEIEKIEALDFEKRIGLINEAVLKSNKDNDVFLLRSDVVMMPNALYNLRLGLYESDDIGACSAVANFAFYMQIRPQKNVHSESESYDFALLNNIPMARPYETKCSVDGNFVLIKRDVIYKVFPIDEYMLSDGSNFTELSLNIIKSGYHNVACWNSYVYRKIREELNAKNKKYLDSDRDKFTEKWGFLAEYYMNVRNEMIDLFKKDIDEEFDVLEVGAGLGTTLLNIQYRYPNVRVKGVEIVQKLTEIAKNYVNIEYGNIETYNFADDEEYDYILFGDVLEHLVDPYTLVDNLKKHLKPGGCIIASIPNILDAEVIYELLHGNFTYMDAGVLDRTHLRFFTQNEVVKLFTERGYEIVDLYGLPDHLRNSRKYGDFFDKLTRIEGVVDRSAFDMLQYLVCAKKKEE